jgi:hypothetical protein
MDKKQQIIAALRAFVAQRSGMEFADYGDVTSYRAEQRAIMRDGKEARLLLRDIELRDSITAEMILNASKHAYSGRLSIVERDDGAIAVDYCAGQYFPTEYRRAVCAVCASVLWDWTRAHAMPEPVLMHNSETGETLERYQDMRAGDWLRAKFRKEYGRAIASRWFN